MSSRGSSGRGSWTARTTSVAMRCTSSSASSTWEPAVPWYPMRRGTSQVRASPPRQSSEGCARRWRAGGGPPDRHPCSDGHRIGRRMGSRVEQQGVRLRMRRAPCPSLLVGSYPRTGSQTPALLGRVAAVDIEGLAGDERRLVRAEPRHSGGHLLRPTRAPRASPATGGRMRRSCAWRAWSSGSRRGRNTTRRPRRRRTSACG